MKRNYDSVSLHAKKDAAQNQKILDMKAQYEKEIDELKTAKLDAEQELKEVKVHLSSAEAKNKDLAVKMGQQTKEIETLKKELVRQQKNYEGQLAQASAGNKAMFEEKGKMLAEMRKMKDELKEAVEQNSLLSERLAMVQDSARAIGNLKEMLGERDTVIATLSSLN